jgi:hypothetical protein
MNLVGFTITIVVNYHYTKKKKKKKGEEERNETKSVHMVAFSGGARILGQGQDFFLMNKKKLKLNKN